MALLNKSSFKYMEKERNSIHELTDAIYTIFSKDGETFFQIDTFGSSKREIPGKISQSLQIDKKMAELLVEKLRETFTIG